MSSQAWWWNNNASPIQQHHFHVKFGDMPEFVVKSVTLPTLEFGEGQYRLGNHMYKYPGVTTWGDLTLTVVESKRTTQKLWEELYRAGYSWSGRTGGAIQKNCNVIVYQHATAARSIDAVDNTKPPEEGTFGAFADGVNNAVGGFFESLGFTPPPNTPTPVVQDAKFFNDWNVWYFSGAFIKSVSFGEHDYSSEELLSMEVVVAFDSAFMMTPGSNRAELRPTDGNP